MRSQLCVAFELCAAMCAHNCDTRQSCRLVTIETLITILTIENLNSWQSLVPDNQLWHWTAFAILAIYIYLDIHSYQMLQRSIFRYSLVSIWWCTNWYVIMCWLYKSCRNFNGCDVNPVIGSPPLLPSTPHHILSTWIGQTGSNICKSLTPNHVFRF